MIGQLDADCVTTWPLKAMKHLISYGLVEGRPVDHQRQMDKSHCLCGFRVRKDASAIEESREAPIYPWHRLQRHYPGHTSGVVGTTYIPGRTLSEAILWPGPATGLGPKKQHTRSREKLKSSMVPIYSRCRAGSQNTNIRNLSFPFLLCVLFSLMRNLCFWFGTVGIPVTS